MNRIKKQVWKRLMAFMMALALVLGSFVLSADSVRAEDSPHASDPKITIVPSFTTVKPKNAEDPLAKRFKAYQVFSGTVEAAKDDELADVDWGNALVKTVDGKKDYTQVKKLLETLISTDWDDNAATHVDKDTATKSYTCVPNETETDQIARAFAEIYMEFVKDLDEHTTTEDLIENAARTAAQEVAELLSGTYRIGGSGDPLQYFKNTAGPVVTSMQKFAHAVKTVVVEKDGEYVETGDDETVYHRYVSRWDASEEAWVIDDTSAGTDLPMGYYFIDDTKTSPDEGDSVAPYMLDVFKSVSVDIKSTSPILNKSIAAVNDNKDGVSDTGNTAVANIGDIITYTLVGTLPKEFGSFYNKYQYEFHDTLSTGLTFVTKGGSFVSNDDIQVEMALDGLKEDSSEWMKVGSSNYTAEVSGQNITVKFTDLIGGYFKKGTNGYQNDRSSSTKYSGTTYDFNSITWSNVKIRVTYKAKLNENALILSGNENTAYIAYTNDPNTEGTGLTETTKDSPKVYTFQIDLQKVGSDNTEKKLGGAKFKVSRTISSDSKEYATFSGTGGVYTLTGWVKDASAAAEIETVADQDLVLKGLDEGTYLFEETEAPPTYDKVDPFEVTITAAKDSGEYNGKLDSGDGKLKIEFPDNTHPDGNAAFVDDRINAGNGKAVVKVTDMKASILPHTGGSGVYFYYIVGGLLVAFAVVVLFVRRKKAGQKA